MDFFLTNWNLIQSAPQKAAILQTINPYLPLLAAAAAQDIAQIYDTLIAEEVEGRRRGT
jgi:hypothetical protein